MKLKMLYADDEPINLSHFAMFFRDDFEVLTALNPEEAMAHVARHNDIAITVSDQRMYGMTGVQLLDKIREKLPHTVSIIFSAYNITEDMVEAINGGRIMTCMLKPWRMDRLQQIVGQAREIYLTERHLKRQMLRAVPERVASSPCP